LPVIKRRSVVLQLRDELKKVIVSKGLKPGDQMLPEAEVAARFGVARGTVREAFKLLEQDGLIDVKHGRGRFVSAISGLLVERPVTEFESVTEMLTGLGYQPVNKVISVEQGRPSEEEAAALELAPDAEVVRVKRLRTHKKKALIYDINTFDAALLQGESVKKSDFSGSLNEWLGERGHPPISSAARIRATVLPAEAAQLPGINAENPWLLISERCVDPAGVPVLYSQDFHRADVFSFYVLRQRAT
jgi:Transcriptional regulators